jgi:hypothetical protein
MAFCVRSFPDNLFDVSGLSISSLSFLTNHETVDEIFLKTIIPSRKATKEYLESNK